METKVSFMRVCVEKWAHEGLKLLQTKPGQAGFLPALKIQLINRAERYVSWETSRIIYL